MSDRFEKLYFLPNQLYTPSAPVKITAGALLKDTQTGKVLTQLKIKNISPKIIKAVTISLLPFDTALQPMGEKETHQLLDLSAQRDSEFGQKTPLYFSNYATRAFQVIIENVIFADNTTWKSDGAPLSDLPPQRLAADALADAELEKQYGLEYGESAAYVGDTCFDLWRCKCGAVNHNDEASCHNCNTPKDAALSFDLEHLKDSCQKRLEEERIKSEQELAQSNLQKKKAKKRNCLIIIFAAVVLLSLAVSNYLVNRQSAKKYESALTGSTFLIRGKEREIGDKIYEIKGRYYFSELKCQAKSFTMERDKTKKGGGIWRTIDSTEETCSYHVRCRNFGKKVYVVLDRDEDRTLSATEIHGRKIQKMSIGAIELILRE